MLMQSYQIVEAGKPLALRRYDVPKPTGSEILLRVDGCGVCHTDIHLWHGVFNLGGGKRITLADRGSTLPFTMGHEIAGTVEALGPQASGLRPGAKGVVYPWIGCGSCHACQHGRELFCSKQRTIGTRVSGGYSNYVIVPHPRYLVDYGEIDTLTAATLACSGLTAFSAFRKLPPLSEDDAVVVLGAGGVGLAAIGIASALSPARVIAAETDPKRREAALRAGASAAFDPSSPDAPKIIQRVHPRAPCAIIDCVGTERTAQFALDTVGRGGTLVFVGLFGGELPVSVSHLAMQNVALRGSNVGTIEEFRELIALANARAFPMIPVEARPMADASAILSDLEAGKITGRVVMRP